MYVLSYGPIRRQPKSMAGQLGASRLFSWDFCGHRDLIWGTVVFQGARCCPRTALELGGFVSRHPDSVANKATNHWVGFTKPPSPFWPLEKWERSRGPLGINLFMPLCLTGQQTGVGPGRLGAVQANQPRVGLGHPEEMA
jgi:hypothetical protein